MRVMDYHVVVMVLFCFAGLLAARADTQLWSTRTGDWSVVDNWTNTTDPGNTRVPVAGDDVVVTNIAALVLLTNSTEWLSSLVISNATVSCSNWDTTIYVTNLTILKSGVLTCSGPFTNTAMSNRVSLNCTNLFIETNGSINVQGKGWSGGADAAYINGSGPGGGSYMKGAGYGGAGMQGEAIYRLTNTYGSATLPLDPGSGGWSGTTCGSGGHGGHGGGAVCITAVQVVVNGSINANCSNTVSTVHGTAGSGGGIYIMCDTITGTNGVITANAGNPQMGHSGGGGGGGRIAVWYNTNSQSGLLNKPSIQFQAAPSLSADRKTVGDIGTLYFPDSALFSPSNLFTGQWVGPGPTNTISLSEWTVSNVWLRMPGFDLTVTNTLTIIGTNYLINRMEFTNGAAIRCGNLLISGAIFGLGGKGDTSVTEAVSQPTVVCNATGPTLNCANNLTLTNNSRFYVYAGLTNSGAEAGYGARVIVGNELRIFTNCWIYPAAHPTNGAVTLFTAHTVMIHTNGGFNADRLGYGGGLSGVSPYGPGTGTVNGGSGYGGSGGNGSADAGGGVGGATYGSSNAPVVTGSGAKYGSAGTADTKKGPDGGGSVQLRVIDSVTIQGTITANGRVGSVNYNGGSSGGSIYIACRQFIGDSNGVLRANGGNGHYYGTPPVATGGGGGGGGRIAVWRIFDRSSSTISNYVNGGIGYNAETGGVGTVVWGWLIPPNGTIVTIH